MKLWQYVLRRLALLVPVLIGISIITFGLAWFATHGHLETQYISLSDRLSPEKQQRIIEQHGFDKPAYVQYFLYVENIFKGDLGISTSTAPSNAPVTQVMSDLYPASAELAITAMIFAVLLGIPLGILSATHRDKPADHVSRFTALSGVSVPVFWLALILQLYLSYYGGTAHSYYVGDLATQQAAGNAIHAAWDHVMVVITSWAPPLNGRFDPNLLSEHPVLLTDHASACAQAAELGTACHAQTGFLLVDTILWHDWPAFLDVTRHLLLPAFTLGFVTLAVIMRMMRASMLEVLGLDYVRTARAKGLDERVVINRHARRNALIPTLTVVGLAVGGLMGGAVLTETIFSWPGLGRWSTRAILSVDVGALMGFVLLTALIYVVANLIVDLLYAYLDPRVKLE